MAYRVVGDVVGTGKEIDDIAGPSVDGDFVGL